jgi:hypothetical protein
MQKAAVCASLDAKVIAMPRTTFGTRLRVALAS